jgi:hypothetical protein
MNKTSTKILQEFSTFGGNFPRYVYPQNTEKYDEGYDDDEGKWDDDPRNGKGYKKRVKQIKI